MNFESTKREYRLLLVLSFVSLATSLSIWAQVPERGLFPLMPAVTAFTPKVIKGNLPRNSKISTCTAKILPKPFHRNGKSYSQLAVSYGKNSSVLFTLRQRADTVWLAMNTHLVDWDAAAEARRLPAVQAHVRQLQASYPAFFAAIPAGFEEEPFLRFNAQIGEKWVCYQQTRQQYAFYRVELEDIIIKGQAEPQYLFSVNYSGHVSHMPSLLKIKISKARGVQGMVWYDYRCSKQGGCDDITVDYTVKQ
ncbi:hypothetical protein [Hymenobacter psychrotolerans]|uniref:hypothetical protein n=1 Tax=Hymenobacter psychrotolerans TaxID=344998 RepID=UPI000934F421|nr:hypothetical protein [Hymenobacter psychrotolerans]